MAEWLEAAIGVEIPELGQEDDENPLIWTTNKVYDHYMTEAQKQAWYEAIPR